MPAFYRTDAITTTGAPKFYQIELFFKELKSDLKMSQYKFKRFDQVAGWVELCVLSFAYLEWQRAVKLEQANLSEPERADREHARTHRIKGKLREELEREELQKMYDWTQTPEGIHQLRAYLGDALKAQGVTEAAA